MKSHEERIKYMSLKLPAQPKSHHKAETNTSNFVD